MKNYRAGIYLRLSKEHAEENNSIEAQREITTNYAIKNNYQIVKEYVDNGYSGILDSRPGLNELIIDILRGFINMVIVKDISRLTRNKNKTGWYTEVFFPDNDVRFISVTEFIDSGDRYEIDDSIMLRGIANQYYILDISKKIRENKKAMKLEGKYVESAVPYGYKKSNNNKYKIVVDKVVAKNVKLIFDMYVNGNTGLQIAKYLNLLNIENPSRYLKMKNASKEWSAETVNNILSNPIYVGDTVMNKYISNCLKKTCVENKKSETWIIKENTHTAIVTKEQFEMVQKIKKSRSNKRSVKYEYWLKDLLFCGECKHKLQYKVYNSVGKNENLYNNRNNIINNSNGFICNIVYKKPNKCQNRSFINERYLNEIVIDTIKKKLSRINMEEAINIILKYYKKNDKLVNELNLCINKIEKLERRKNILYNKKCDKYITDIEFKQGYNTIKEEIKELHIKKIKLEDNCKQILSKDKIKEIVTDFKSCKDFSNEILKKIVNRIEIYSNRHIEIVFNF